jgi:SAM-dependent methyltransferase
VSATAPQRAIIAPVPAPLATLRHRLGVLRWRLVPPRDAKGRDELSWWLNHWDPGLRAGELQGPDTLALSGEDAVAETYEGRRWQQARAELRRVLVESHIDEPDFFAGKVVLDIGSGPLGFPDAVAAVAAVSLSVEPLTGRFQAAGLLLDSSAVYLDCGAERIPLRSGSVDVVVSRNNLDHVDDPVAVLDEVRRILRPGGWLILNVDIEHTPTSTEPHRIDLPVLRGWLAPLRIERELKWDHPHGDDGHAVVVVARKP